MTMADELIHANDIPADHPVARMHPRSIAVIAVTRIGDTLLCTPALRALATHWPQARLSFYGHPDRAPIIEHLPFVHEVHGIRGRSAGVRRLFSKPTYDLCFVYGNDPDLIKFARKISKTLVGTVHKDPHITALLDFAVPEPAFQKRHAVNYTLNLVESCGIAQVGRRLQYQRTEEERTWAKRFLEDKGMDGTGPLIGLQIASFATKSFRDWPVENFMALCERLQNAMPDARFLVFGGPDEKDRTRALQAHMGPHALDLAGTLTLRNTAALMGELDLYIGVDTGPTHIMGTFDIPIVPMYHGSSASWFLMPLEHPCCFPVDHPQAGRVGTDASMAEVSVDTVFDKALRALRYDRPSHADTH